MAGHHTGLQPLPPFPGLCHGLPAALIHASATPCGTGGASVAEEL